MVLRLILFFAFTFCVARLAAQSDTTILAPVEIYGVQLLKYSVGSKVQELATRNSAETLTDRLNAESSMYFKNYGNQQLSTISFRGTTASQTAVLWNGVNVNSPTLGLTDFSTIPVFLFDEVAVHFGASSALVGTDAIGGSIALKSSAPMFARELNTTLLQQAGSFGRLASGIKFRVSTDRWFFSTRLVYTKIENNFPYTSPAVGYRRTQENAAVKNTGFSKQLAYKINESQQLTLEGIYAHNFRENQPAVTNFGANETIRDRQYRIALNYDNTSSLGILRTTVAHIRDVQVYFDDKDSKVQTSQWTVLMNVDKQLGKKTSIRWGASFAHHNAAGENYPDNLKDNRADVFGSLRYSILKSWVLSANLRQTKYDNKYAPFTPSIGTEITALKRNKSLLKLRAQAGRAFRIPTLNDRFWQPGGNQNLKAENALQEEMGISWTYTADDKSLETEITHYQTQSTDMIVWQTKGNGIRTPNNLQKVDIKGAEVNTKWANKIGNYRVQTSLAYSFTSSINKGGDTEAYMNKQLPYVPIHAARIVLHVNRDYWDFRCLNSYNSRRFVAFDNIDYLEPYFLTDLTFGKSFFFNKTSLSTSLQANNIFDLYYENLNNRAMPGRSFLVSVSLNFTNQTK